MSELFQYNPGVCNIGPAEIRRRWITGWVGSILSIMTGIVCILTGLPHGWRFIVVIPVMFAAIGFIQAGTKFCAGYGWMGVFNVEGIGSKPVRIEEAESVQRDRARAVQLITAAFFIALVIGTLFFIAPLRYSP